ncbi:HK97-gp10 family putative phage morphogenesis protein [Acetobacter ghanensis]|uniref:Burkholderia phage Bcep781 gp07 n=1 Tax=Acetobacter ghanensis TaxID=431306 RepID=A0A0U5F3R8_9PROT|nr:hypothetical protein [Acetobacter ghanensis]NHO39470.1 hypothetical protein [Acetobacter ghanensis]GBQ46402.1 hypothetical protein AA18895_0753 [Acetobacter ghanensis DSM 18895]CEF54621.1 Burkholderia phage Bcep781 gp07 [Acetobacter ghanensis]
MAVKIKSVGGVGLENALKQLQEKIGQGAHVRSGFLENATYPDGTPVAQVAYWDEYGTKTAPPRPFMRTAIANNKGDWGRLMGAVLKATGYNVNQALALVGEKITDQVKQEIVSFTAPENSMLTNILKERFPTGDYTKDDFLKAVSDLKHGATASPGKPLVWSGVMLNSAAYDVKEGPE